MTDKKNAIDTIPEIAATVVILVGLGVVIGGYAFFTTPSADLKVQNQFRSQVDYTEDELVFSEQDIERLSDSVTQSQVEDAFCLEITEEGVVDVRFPLNTSGSTRYRVASSCTVYAEGQFHSHPALGATTEPSDQDKRTWLAFYQYGCIAAGEIEAVDNPAGMDCYKVPDVDIDSEEEFNETVENTEFPRVNIRVSGSG